MRSVVAHRDTFERLRDSVVTRGGIEIPRLAVIILVDSGECLSSRIQPLCLLPVAAPVFNRFECCADFERSILAFVRCEIRTEGSFVVPFEPDRYLTQPLPLLSRSLHPGVDATD